MDRKTTLADELAPAIEGLGRPVIRASIDGFHHPAAVRRRRGPMSPEGYYRDSFNHVAIIESLLGPLGPAGSLMFRRAVFNLRSDQPVDAPVERAEPNAVLIFDGVFLLRPELREYLDFSIFVRADFAVTVARAEARDAQLFGSVEDVRRRYQERYVPGQQIYLAEVDPERRASLIIDNTDPAHPLVERPEAELPRWVQISAGVLLGLFTLLCLAGTVAVFFVANAKAPILAPVICLLMVAGCGWVLEMCIRLVSGVHPVTAIFQTVVYVGLFFTLQRIAGARDRKMKTRVST